MKAEIINERLSLIPESESELTAISGWFERHVDGCSFIMKPLDLRKDIAVGSIAFNGITPLSIIKDRELHPEQKIVLLNTLFKEKFTLSAATILVKNYNLQNIDK